MNSPVVTHHLTKTFGRHAALRSIDLEIPAGRVVGLLGRNGAGKTTLLNIACGLVLPTEGWCETLGKPVEDLGSSELAQLGLVPQEARLIAWMRVREHLAFNAAFYRRWDADRQNLLLKELELPLDRKVGQLSSGDRQKLSVILGVCHHPSLLLLDEPVSSLDPVVRARMLDFLLSVVREDECTAVISSHILTDLEKVIDWVVCMDQGEVAVSAPLDEIQESYGEWIVTSPEGELPVQFSEPFVISREGDAHQARLHVRRGQDAEQSFCARYRAEIVSRPLTLEQLFPLLIKDRRVLA
jgi:ABC-2 type transport system ATP-binding protein